jgi:periplasmic copper chaperone A
MKNLILTMASAGAVAILAGHANAHITLEQTSAQANTNYKAVMRVSHGCGNLATTGVRIQLPAGVLDVKPMPKAGWQLKTVEGPLAEPYKDSHGALVTQGIVEVAWTGGSLANEHYDEFIFRMRTPSTPGVTIWFPIVQECERGEVTRWIEVPAAGKSIGDYRTPAAPLRLLAP